MWDYSIGAPPHSDHPQVTLKLRKVIRGEGRPKRTTRRMVIRAGARCWGATRRRRPRARRHQRRRGQRQRQRQRQRRGAPTPGPGETQRGGGSSPAAGPRDTVQTTRRASGGSNCHNFLTSTCPYRICLFFDLYFSRPHAPSSEAASKPQLELNPISSDLQGAG